MQKLDDALRLGTARLTVVRSGALLDVDLEALTGCKVSFQLIPDKRLSASADAVNVFVTSGLVGYTSSDDELALLLGHELAHVLLGHVEAGRTSSGESRPSFVERRERERAADRLGLLLMARAGYDVSRVSDFWRRLAADKPLLALSQFVHPRPKQRAAEIAAATEEVLALIAQGALLDASP